MTLMRSARSQVFVSTCNSANAPCAAAFGQAVLAKPWLVLNPSTIMRVLTAMKLVPGDLNMVRQELELNSLG
jgi:hypothetical protein